jgi:hypothetical protein
VQGSRITLALVGVALAVLAFAGMAASGERHPQRQRQQQLQPPSVHALRVQTVAHVDPGGGYTADVVALKNYAYLSSWRGDRCPALGVRVYDLHDPRHPVHVSTFADAASEPAVAGSWTEKTIVRHVQTASFTGDVAATSFQSCKPGTPSFHGFGLYDVTNPAKPRRLALVSLSPRGSHEIWLAAAKRHAWVYTAIPNSELTGSPDYDPKTGRASTPGPPDFRIFDVSDPRNPRQVGGWGAWKQLGIRPSAGRGRFPANFVHSVMTNAAATRALLSYWDLGTVILDISRPASPRYLGRTPASDPEGDAHSAWLADGGKVLIETHENSVGQPFFYDISNPRKPRLIAKFGPVDPSATSFESGVHDPKVLGKRAYFSWYSRGVLVADISKPRRPRLVARLLPRAEPDTSGSLCKSACRLTWGVFPTKKYVLAADMISGLWIFRVS